MVNSIVIAYPFIILKMIPIMAIKPYTASNKCHGLYRLISLYFHFCILIKFGVPGEIQFLFQQN